MGAVPYGIAPKYMPGVKSYFSTTSIFTSVSAPVTL